MLDFSEINEMLDLYSEREPLMHYKPREDGGTFEPFDREGKRLPIDLETMRYQGVGGSPMHDTFLGYLGSALSKGERVADAIEAIVEAAERHCKNDPARDKWRKDLAEKATWWLEKHPEWLYTALNREDEDAWNKAIDAKRRVALVFGRWGLGIRSWAVNGDAGEPVAEAKSDSPVKEEKKDSGRRRPIIFTSAGFTAGFVPPDYLIDGVLQRRYLYSLTGPTGHGKTCVLLLIAAHVGLGRDLGPHTVGQGRVMVLAGENPDDVRMRWIAMAEALDFDPEAIPVDFLPGVFPIGEMKREIERRAESQGCGYSLVVVDTSAAYFAGTEENANVQMGKHARELRSFVEVPGGPTALVSCHPTKNADLENLLPRGGGAYIAEVDGNLVCRKGGGENVTEVHWHGKFRGPDFNPLAFELREVTTAKLVDSAGKVIPTILATPLDEYSQSSKRAESRKQEDQLLTFLVGKAGLSVASIASGVGWQNKLGEPDKSKTQRVLKRLVAAHLVKFDRGEWCLTEAGSKAEKKAQGRW